MGPGIWPRLYDELGIKSLYDTGRDAWLVMVARSARMFAYGANSLIIALFFAQLEFSDFRIGVFMSLTLLGDVILTIGLTFTADKYGRRRTILLGSALMIISGATFVLSENFWLLLIAAVVGVISASGGDFGPFRAIEESMLSQITAGKPRNDVLAWYVTMGSFGSAIGTEASGRIVDGLASISGWTRLDAYHTIFGLYVIMGILNAVMVLLMSERLEAKANQEIPTEEEEVLLEERASMTVDRPVEPKAPPTESRLLSVLSPTTRSVMFKLWPLLALDSVADGMATLSLTTYYMDQKFHTSTATLGDINSISYFLAAASTIFAGPLANHLGLVNTMVFTHIPSSAAVLFFPLPRGLAMTIVLFFIRTGLNNMDQAPRSAFIAAVVKPEERTAVLGFTSTLRTLSAVAGPSVTGLLAGSDKFWLAFVVAGSFRLLYDFGLWALFINMKLDGVK